MKYTFKLLILSLLMLSTANTSIADSTSTLKYKKSNLWVHYFAKVYEQYAELALKKTRTPGAAIAIVKDGEIILTKGFGVLKEGQSKRVNKDTVFRLGSLSKGFAPVLTGLLVEEGILDWEDKVVKYLPNFRLSNQKNTQKLSIRHLLSMTTGLPKHTYTNLIEEGYTFAQMVARLKNVYSSRVGYTYSYQNVVYSVIADILEKATGKSYEQLMEERIFGPLGMNNSSVSYQDFVKNPNIALPHRNHGHKCVATKVLKNYYEVVPAAGVNASIEDMAKWLQGLSGYYTGFVKNATLRKIFTPVVKTPMRRQQFLKWRNMQRAYYAMGWRIFDFADTRLIYHAGYVNYYKAEIAIWPEEHLSVVILTNAPTRFSHNALPMFFKLYDEYKQMYERI